MSNNDRLYFHLERCFYNNRKSQKYIFEKYYSFTRDLCEYYTIGHEELAALINQSFLLAFKNIPLDSSKEIPGEPSFRKWLRKWVICAIVDHCRKNFRHSLILNFKHSRLNSPTVLWRNFLNTICPSMHKKTSDEINWIIQSLQPSDKIILNLIVLENFNDTDLANCLGTSLQTASANISNAINRVKRSVSIFKTEDNYCVAEI